MSWTVDPMHTQVEFSAKHMGLMTVKGHFTGVRVSIDLNEDDFTASAVEATIDTRSLVTNDARRDAHLKSPDFLNVEQFPAIHFKSTRVERAAHDQYKMTGELTIRNVARAVTLRLNPLGLGPALDEYWAARLEGREKGGRDLLRRLGERGVPLPFAVP